MVWLSKFVKTFLKRKLFSPPSTWKVESIHLADMIHMIKSSWINASIMIWNKIVGITRLSNDQMAKLSTNCTKQDPRAAVVSMKTILSTFLEDIHVTRARWQLLRNLIFKRRKSSRWICWSRLQFAASFQSRYRLQKFSSSVDLAKTVKSSMPSSALILTKSTLLSNWIKLIVQALWIAQSFWIRSATYICLSRTIRVLLPITTWSTLSSSIAEHKLHYSSS